MKLKKWPFTTGILSMPILLMMVLNQTNLTKNRIILELLLGSGKSLNRRTFSSRHIQSQIHKSIKTISKN